MSPQPHHSLRLLSLILMAVCFSAIGQAQYLLETGSPTFATTDSVPMGFINIANGNLHIEIPIANIPQRGGRPFVATMVYDSRIWKIVDNGSSQSWQPTNVYGTTPNVPTTPPGWRFEATDRTAVTQDSILNQCTYQGNIYYWYQHQNYRFIDTSGTVRRFPLYEETSVPCHTAATGTDSGPALDATAYWMEPNSNQPGAQEVLAPDGTKEYFRGVPYGPVIPWEDPNGNYLHRDLANGWVTYDTLSRPVMQITAVGNNELDYTVQTAAGSATYKMYFNSLVSVNTNFGVSGVTEFNGGWYTLSEIEFPDGSSYQFSYEDTGNKYGLLKDMTLPTGASVQFTHANFTDAQGNRNRWVNTETVSDDTTTYTPATCGTNCNQTTVTRPSGDETVYTFALNNGAWNTLTEAYTDSAASGTLAMTVEYTYDTTLNDPVSGGAAFVRRIGTTTTMPGPSGNLVKKTEADYDTFTYSYRGTNYTGSRGNTLAMREFGYGSGTPGPLLRQTVFSYLHDSNPNYLSNNIVRRQTNAQIKDASGTKITESNTAYDSTALGSMTGITHHDDTLYGTGNTLRGNPTAIERWTGSSYLSTTYTYDTTGQVVSTVDPNGGVTELSYADNFYLDDNNDPPAPYSPAPPPTNAFITQMTLPVSGTLSYGYYYGSGKRAFLKDQNNNTSYLHYQDALDRPTQKTLPGGAWVQNQFSTTTHITHTASVAAGTYQDQHDNDMLGRSYTGSMNDPEGTIYGTSSYDSSGRLQSVTNPFRSASDPTYGSYSIQYDGLNRVTRLTFQDGNYTEAFYGAAVGEAGGRTTQLCSPGSYGIGYPALFKDEVGKKRQSWSDALNRIIEVDEPDTSGALVLATCSKYDAAGNLIQVDQGSQTRLSVYDALSRRTEQSTPEGGTEYFYYTTAGGGLCVGDPRSVCRVTDARGITTTYTYDAENRLTGTSYSNGDPSASYFYDQTSYNGLTITNGKGRRTGMSDGSGQAAWSYNAAGEILVERRTISGITKNISYSYNADGSLNQLTYPSGMVINHTYNTAKRLTRISKSCPSPDYYCWHSYFADNAAYAPNGALARLRVGYNWYYGSPGGVTTTYTYNQRLQPENITATRNNGTVTLLDLTYNFLQAGGKNNGTITSLTNNLSTGRTQTFTYDELNRLKTAQSQANSGADCWGQSFSYDRYGNLSSITVTKCSAPALSLAINNNNQISNGGFSYDPSGNLVADGFSTYTWTAADQLASTAGVSYSYDGDHHRVKKSNGKLYWYGLRGEVLAESDLSGVVQSEYVYFNGRRIARRDVSGGAVYYYITDHIGSARVMADANGQVVEESDFYPFGTERVITDTMNNSIKFADMERDNESALDHTLYRQYSASLARWLSPDIKHGSPTNPQSLNRYPYVLNAPLTLTDPLGSDPNQDPFLLGCFPDPFFVSNFEVGCGWDSLRDPCPPGFEPIYGDRRPGGGPAIETLQSVLEYADLRLGPYSPGVLNYELGDNNLNVTMSMADFRTLAAFNPVLVEVIPYIITGGEVLIELLKIATVAVLADMLDSLMIQCEYTGGNRAEENPRTRACIYRCDDGSIFFLEGVPVTEKCPKSLVRIRSIFFWH